MKGLTMFFKYIDAETVSKALDDIRFEFFEHFQAANSKIKDLQHKLDLYEFKNADRQLVITEKLKLSLNTACPLPWLCKKLPEKPDCVFPRCNSSGELQTGNIKRFRNTPELTCIRNF